MREKIEVGKQLPNSTTGAFDIVLIRSGLTRQAENQMYRKLKNEGKCCEGGSEGWTG